MALSSPSAAGIMIDAAAPVLTTSSSFSSVASSHPSPAASGYDGTFDNMLSSGGNTSQSSLVSAGQPAQFISLLSCPPILVCLVENIGVNDLKSLRLVCTHANDIIADSAIYHSYLKRLAISCSEATSACRWATRRSKCFRCEAEICNELPRRRRIVSGVDAMDMQNLPFGRNSEGQGRSVDVWIRFGMPNMPASYRQVKRALLHIFERASYARSLLVQLVQYVDGLAYPDSLQLRPHYLAAQTHTYTHIHLLDLDFGMVIDFIVTVVSQERSKDADGREKLSGV
ncbi:hypothetical protein POJ06DRAFT_235729 [Lipomyces tetrasporus]|uniref:F-box domain-containing protein n=1 Tax=Lipomyces tetrasporus TaxID=54092 RepID=A0AAD7VVA9_9ASCO|nr:uncharacterized protein POJ06DRAFT_235729 [Lipomyces tetrasporus]KAJ8102774.1 hypothetical protein POJ06DRAFT_235729 [Lipomyces tetrasporus]